MYYYYIRLFNSWVSCYNKMQRFYCRWVEKYPVLHTVFCGKEKNILHKARFLRLGRDAFRFLVHTVNIKNPQKCSGWGQNRSVYNGKQKGRTLTEKQDGGGMLVWSRFVAWNHLGVNQTCAGVKSGSNRWPQALEIMLIWCSWKEKRLKWHERQTESCREGFIPRTRWSDLGLSHSDFKFWL